MLDYFVTSKARRRLLRLLWGEDASGSVSELAERAHVGFASAHQELRAMQTLRLVVAVHTPGARVYAANSAHPLASVLRALSLTPDHPLADEEDERTRRQLRTLGAPLLGESEPVKDAAETLVRGAELAHHDGTVASVLPVCLYLQRDALRPDDLLRRAREFGEEQVVGFLLDLTALLSGDRRFADWARRLRDRRVTGVRYLFADEGRTALGRRLAEQNTPAAARRWGLRMNLGLDAFASMFERHARHA